MKNELGSLVSSGIDPEKAEARELWKRGHLNGSYSNQDPGYKFARRAEKHGSPRTYVPPAERQIPVEDGHGNSTSGNKFDEQWSGNDKVSLDEVLSAVDSESVFNARVQAVYGDGILDIGYDADSRVMEVYGDAPLYNLALFLGDSKNVSEVVVHHNGEENRLSYDKKRDVISLNGMEMFCPHDPDKPINSRQVHAVQIPGMERVSLEALEGNGHYHPEIEFDDLLAKPETMERPSTDEMTRVYRD